VKIATTVKEIRELRPLLKGTLGFVPTMGYLHQGHLSLVRKARAENSSVIVSIFVNPTQFESDEDLKHYPRNTERDIQMLANENVDAVFMPEVAEMYPPGFGSWVEVGNLSSKLEGASRPGHFRGVTTILTKLFNIIQPDRAYFGQKDIQQAIIVKKMVQDLNMDTKISIQPIVREPSGLAMSSRNARLNPEERQKASVIYQALKKAKEVWQADEKDTAKIKDAVESALRSEPLISIDYVSIVDAETLDELERIERPAFVLVAVKIGKIRLIDNMLLGEAKEVPE
jgi:pantoate--beta-alanine ligase